MNDINPVGSLLGLIFVVAIVVGLFLLFRKVLLWYWKVDRAIELLEKIEQNTKK